MASVAQNRNMLRRGLEITLNVIILTASIALVFAVVRNRLGPGKNPQSSVPGPPKGEKIEVPGVEWSNSQRTVVLVLNTHCPFCTASAGFYKRLQGVAKSKGVPVVAVLPQPSDEARSYLEGLHVPVAVVRQSPLSNVHVYATPTLVLLNSEGKVIDSWVGKLSPKLEKEVISRL